ncbi:MAG TPA: ABC transporter ATP-binding protein [Acidimicrobiales bacterium]
MSTTHPLEDEGHEHDPIGLDLVGTDAEHRSGSRPHGREDVDVTGDESIDSWRGVAAEDVDDVRGSLATLLRSRSRRLLGSLLAPHKRSMTWATVLIAVNMVAHLSGPWFVGQAIDEGIPPLLDDGSGSVRPLLTIVGAYLLATVVAAGSFNAFLLVSGRIGQEVIVDIRRRLSRHFTTLSLSFHQRYTSGRVISRQTSDVDAIAELLGHGLLQLTTSSLTLVGITIILIVLDPLLALAALSVVPVLWLLTRWFRHHSEQAYRATREAIALVIVHFVESLGGIQAVQSFRRERRNQEIFDDLDRRYSDANVWSSRLAATYGPGVQFAGRATVAVVLLYGGTRVIDGAIEIGVLASFVLYLRRFFEPMTELSQFYNLFQAAAAATEKLSGVLDEEPTVAPPTDPEPLPEAAGAVTLEGVTFAYGDDVVLHDVDLVVPAGQTVAVVGETGAGKSTIARLTARFWDPTEGTVCLDGVPLAHLDEQDLRRAVVVVTQESFLFSGTVADNIEFGRPGAGRAEIEGAAQAIGADGFIRRLPKGYDTDIQAKGARLSAGQRQLLAFARAFLADPAVLILDEATSSLDIPSERAVQRALRTLLADRTAIIIAHRLTTVEIADRILVVAGGRIVEDGAPEDLRSGAGAYGDLHRAWIDSLI